MKLYKVENLNEYIDVVNSTLISGNVDVFCTQMSMFHSHDEFISYFNFDPNSLFDQATDEALYDDSATLLPDSYIYVECEKRLLNYDLSFPFYIIVSGSEHFNGVGLTTQKIFHEIQNLSKIGE